MATSRPSRSPLESDGGGRVLESVNLLQKRHARVKELSDSLTERIHRFEAWLSRLQGRVETFAVIPDPEPSLDWSLVLRVERSGKKWTVSYGYVFQGDYQDATFTPLAEAGVRVKAAAIMHLPKLVESMVESQEKLAKTIEEANQAFDAFAERVGMPAKEGE